MYRGWTQTDYQNKHYNINPKDEGTWDDRGRDGGTNFILRIKEQETRLTLQEYDDDENIPNLSVFWLCLRTAQSSCLSYRVFNSWVCLEFYVSVFIPETQFLKAIFLSVPADKICCLVRILSSLSFYDEQ